MNDSRFDDIARRLAITTSVRQSRRGILKAAAAAGIATTIGLPELCGAAPAAGPPPIRARRQQTSPDDLLVQQIAFDLDYDLERIFRFVSDEVTYEPYAGVLRGERGTLWARAGNSADQALLLAALLRQSRVDVRFATGLLSEDVARHIHDAARLGPDAIREHAMSFLIGTAVTGGEEPTPPTEEDLQSVVKALPDEAAAIMAAANSQLDDGVATITEALTRAAITIPQGFTAFPDRERTEHVWVQIRLGATWVDLDPTLPGQRRGDVLATAGATLDVLPDTLRHRVRFTVVSERIEGDRLVEEPILEHERFADELVGVPVTFLNAKPEGLSHLGMAITGTLTGAVQYLSTLAVGDTSIVGNMPLSFGQPGGLLDALGQDATTEGEATAQWVDVRIDAIDREPVTVRRDIFDRVGFVARQGAEIDLTALAPVTLVDFDAETPNEYPPCRTVVSFAVVGGAVNGAYFARDFAQDDVFDTLALVGSVHHYIRGGLNADIAVARGVRGFCDAPNVVSYTVVPSAPLNGEIPFSAAVDIWHRSFGTLPVQGTDPVAASGVIVGVLSHVAERLTVGAGTSTAEHVVRSSIGVGSLFEAAKAQEIGVRVLREPMAPSDIQPYGPEARLRLTASVRRGYIAVVPDRPVMLDGAPHTGWWLIDPATGLTVDEFEDGRGVEMSEYSIPLTAEARAILQFKRLAACILKYGSIAAIVLGAGGEAAGYSGASDVGSVLATAAAAAGAAGGLELPGLPGFSLFC